MSFERRFVIAAIGAPVVAFVLTVVWYGVLVAPYMQDLQPMNPPWWPFPGRWDALDLGFAPTIVGLGIGALLSVVAERRHSAQLTLTARLSRIATACVGLLYMWTTF